MGLRVDLMLPEHMVRFKQQMENSRGNASSMEDYTFLFRIFTLLAASQSKTPPTMSELSVHLKLPFSSTTRLIDWLERAKFVERIHDANDRRVVRVHMTATGERFWVRFVDWDETKHRIANLVANAAITKDAIANLAPTVPVQRTCECATALSTAIITQLDLIPESVKTERAPLVGKYVH